MIDPLECRAKCPYFIRCGEKLIEELRPLQKQLSASQADGRARHVAGGLNPAGRLSLHSSALAASAGRGRASPRLCRVPPIRRARRFLWEVGTSYNERRFL